MKILKRIYLMLLILITLIAIGVLLYPSVSNYINNKYAVSTITKYEKDIENTEKEEINKLMKKAVMYNSDIARGIISKSKFENGYMLGYVDIPKINIKLPIYEGTSDEVLKKGVGVIDGTSIPIGGESTHSVLSAHTGLTTQKLFTDIDQLKEGDFFYINIFGERLAYKVDEINIVKPNDTSKINISPNKDYVTLLTCYPYGINTERLLVRGERVFQKDDNFNKAENLVNDNNSRYINKELIFIVGVLTLFLILIIIVILRRKIKN
ncbi:class C sortase (plasmid) [Clostridium perfringens]|uniref:Sortase n=3 Tax=Clostridium perfringens TaxID=1502 RepID=A0A2X3INE5_CLOPF|nr:class C sortase [Clostridium perfringens]EHK2389357.1 class C sortase [Clostridium perfringens]EJT6559855.1 class C sortase [Clostridium perfringens]ELC8420360.1 class C sortase [Clostridium perfringens]ELC8428733.1 class C sortase [Clostridium perfringens]ELC8440669.1 class C sortase [Clostridium perfringens]